MMTFVNVTLVVLGVAVWLFWLASVVALESWAREDRDFLLRVRSTEQKATPLTVAAAINSSAFLGLFGVFIGIVFLYFLQDNHGGSDIGWSLLAVYFKGFGIAGFLVALASIRLFLAYLIRVKANEYDIRLEEKERQARAT